MAILHRDRSLQVATILSKNSSLQLPTKKQSLGPRPWSCCRTAGQPCGSALYAPPCGGRGGTPVSGRYREQRGAGNQQDRETPHLHPSPGFGERRLEVALGVLSPVHGQQQRASKRGAAGARRGGGAGAAAVIQLPPFNAARAVSSPSASSPRNSPSWELASAPRPQESEEPCGSAGTPGAAGRPGGAAPLRRWRLPPAGTRRPSRSRPVEAAPGASRPGAYQE